MTGPRRPAPEDLPQPRTTNARLRVRLLGAVEPREFTDAYARITDKDALVIEEAGTGHVRALFGPDEWLSFTYEREA